MFGVEIESMLKMCHLSCLTCSVLLDTCLCCEKLSIRNGRRNDHCCDIIHEPDSNSFLSSHESQNSTKNIRPIKNATKRDHLRIKMK